jgi:PhnB protein
VVEVRRIRPDEGPVLRAVRIAALTDTPSAFGATLADTLALPDADWEARARRGAAGDEIATFLAVDDGEDDAVPVGVVAGLRDSPADPAVELVSMWTAPSARGQGVARRLVAELVAWARTTPATAVRLWVTDGNAPAERFYATLGFRPTGARQPLPSDLTLMESRMELPLVPDPSGAPIISLMLAVPDATEAVWYRRALGAAVTWDLGSVVGLTVGGVALFLAEPEGGGWSTPAAAGTTTVRVEVFVDDPDAVWDRAVAAGADGHDPVRDHEMPWGTHRQGGFYDPFGHLWLVGDRSPLPRQ